MGAFGPNSFIEPCREMERYIMSLNKALLDILVCPQCKGELQLEDDESGLRCEACRLLYAIRDDIPIMLVDEAQALDS